VLAPDLRVLFCGINPGRVSAAAHAHFANPRNDFWRLLHAAGFTRRLLTPAEQFELLREGVGVTNAASRTTPGSGDLRKADFAGAVERLEDIAGSLKPKWIGFVGKEAYRGAFGERPELGVQERRLGETQLFVLPSTSPANAAVPWNERLRPGDLGVGDLLPAPPDDGRLVPLVVLEGDDAVVDWFDPEADDADAGPSEPGELPAPGRSRVLSAIGRDGASDRWYTSEHGPRSPIAHAAPAHCASCGFFLPLSGELGRFFGACANAYAPDDGRVVSADHGCGAHSEAMADAVAARAVAPVWDVSTCSRVAIPRSARS